MVNNEENSFKELQDRLISAENKIRMLFYHVPSAVIESEEYKGLEKVQILFAEEIKKREDIGRKIDELQKNFSAESTAKLEKIDSQLKNVEGNLIKVNKLESGFQETNKHLGSLEAKINSIEKHLLQFEPVSKEIEALKREDQQINSKIGEVKATISKYSSIDSRFQESESKFESLQHKVSYFDEIAGKIAPINAHIEKLKNNYEEQSDQAIKIIRDIQENSRIMKLIQENNESYSGLEGNLREVKSQVEVVSQKVVYLEEMGRKVGPLNASVEEIKKLQQDQKQQLMKLIQENNESKTKISLVEDRLGKLQVFESKLQEMDNQIVDFRSKVGLFEEITNSIRPLSGRFDKLQNTQQALTDRVNTDFQRVHVLETAINQKLVSLKEFNELKSVFDQYKSSLNQSIEFIKTQIEEKEKIFGELRIKGDEWVRKLETLESQYGASFKGLKNRLENLEEVDTLTLKEEIGPSLDSFEIFKKLTTDLIGTKKANKLIPDCDPKTIAAAMIRVIWIESFVDASNKPSITEILLKYSELTEGKLEKSALILRYTSDILKVLEAGQEALLSIGVEKSRARKIVEEVKSLVKNWVDPKDIESYDSGFSKVIEWLNILEGLY